MGCGEHAIIRRRIEYFSQLSIVLYRGRIREFVCGLHSSLLGQPATWASTPRMCSESKLREQGHVDVTARFNNVMGSLQGALTS